MVNLRNKIIKNAHFLMTALNVLSKAIDSLIGDL